MFIIQYHVLYRKNFSCKRDSQSKKSLIHFHCVLHAKRGGGEGVKIACKITYVLNERR